MKTRMLMSLLVIALAAALVGGATMAWFNDTQDVPEATFTAGTVKVAAGQPAYAEGYAVDNVNPGDCTVATWNIENVGSIAAQIRVELDMEWLNENNEPLDVEDPLKNVAVAPQDGTPWVMYSDDVTGDLWLYYNGDVENGLAPDSNVDLELVIAFDGELTDNDYQNAKFNISGVVEAIQATNGAPEAEWGDVWNTVAGTSEKALGTKAVNYLNYIMNVPCWKGEIVEPDPDPEPEPEPQFVLTAKKVEGTESDWRGSKSVKLSGTVQAQDEDGNPMTVEDETVKVLFKVKTTYFDGRYWKDGPERNYEVDVTLENASSKNFGPITQSLGKYHSAQLYYAGQFSAEIVQ